MIQYRANRHLYFFFVLSVGLAYSAASNAAEPKPKDAKAASPGTSAAAPDRTLYDLRYKLAIGDVLRYQVSHRASIRSTIDETTQSAQTKTDSTKVWKVTDVLPTGDIEVMNVVEHVHMVNQLPDRDPVEYDSKRDTTPPPGFEDAARAVNVPLSVVRITPRGKLVRRDVKIRQQGIDDDAPIVVRLPEKPISIGGSWDDPFSVKVSLENGGTKSIETRRHHTLSSVDTGIATITVKYQVLSPIDAHIESQLVQRLMDGEVKFDVAAGRVVGQQMDIDKRVLGFAGPTSSMHYVVRMEEKLIKVEPKLTTRAPASVTPSPTASGPTRVYSPRMTRQRTSNRSGVPQGAKVYRR